MYYFKRTLVGGALALCLVLSGCQAPSSPVQTETTTQAPASQTILIKDINTTSAGVSQSSPDANIDAVEGLQVKNTTADGDLRGLLRVPLPAAILSEDVISAQLRLKRQSGDNPQLRAIAVNSNWDRLEVTWDILQRSLLPDTATQTGELVEDDWYAIDVTAIVKGWFSGTYANGGVMLEESEPDTSTIFHSPYTETVDYCPELVINYTPSPQGNHAPFAYQKQEDGNCLSYALRDTDAIMATDLNLDTKVLQQRFNTGGSDEAVKYMEELTLAYIEKHADVLKITSIREIPSFDADINPETEYRIAMRIGIYSEKGLSDLPEYGAAFDYHFQMQLSDGSWCQKFGPDVTHIVPGSNAVVDPSLVAWDQHEIWGMSKFSSYYNSKTVYYAVQKDGTEFTTHRK